MFNCLFAGHAVKPLYLVEVGKLARHSHLLVVVVGNDYRLALQYFAALYAADAYAAHIVVIVD